MKKIIYAAIFLISMILVVKGRAMEGYVGLGTMMIGLTGLLAELYLYNRRYQ